MNTPPPKGGRRLKKLEAKMSEQTIVSVTALAIVVNLTGMAMLLHQGYTAPAVLMGLTVGLLALSLV